jgi:hypothetical protein
MFSRQSVFSVSYEIRINCFAKCILFNVEACETSLPAGLKQLNNAQILQPYLEN